jgi:hypothetical protein
MTGSMFRRAFLAVIAMFAVGSLGHAASEAKAVEIRFFVPQSTGLFEVKGSTADGSSPRPPPSSSRCRGAGRFAWSGTRIESNAAKRLSSK